MKKKYKSKLLGFTLIELLFVIAISSILVSLGIVMMQQRNQQAKVEKTALQMQQLMLAGLAYYVDNNCWPETGTCLATTPLFDKYIPINGRTNPWGSSYAFSIQTANAFQVQVNTPTMAIAQRVAGMLPKAGTATCPVPSGGTSPCVYAQTTVSISGGASPSIYVAAVGAVNSYGAPVKVTFPHCQLGYNPSIKFSLRDYTYANIPKTGVGREDTYPEPVSLALCAKKSESDDSYTVKIDPSSFSYRSVHALHGFSNCPPFTPIGSATVFFQWEKDSAITQMFANYTINYTVYCCAGGDLCPHFSTFACSS